MLTENLWSAARVAAAVALFGIGIVHAIVGQPGTLDQSFATVSPQGAGKARLAMTSRDDYVRATALQADGKFLLAGECGSDTGTTVCVARYLADGTPDTAWGVNGMAFASIGQFGASVSGVALQSDSSVIVLATCLATELGTQALCVVRFSNAGTLDTSWGNAGLAAVEMVQRGVSAGAIAIDSSNRVYLAGSCIIDFGDTDFCAARLTASGLIDTSWGTQGKTVLRLSNQAEQAKAVALRSSGELLLAGSCGLASGASMCSAQLNASGTLDGTWGSNGFATTMISNNSSGANAIFLTQEGRALLAGTCFGGTVNGMCTAMLDSSGALASAWNTVGYTIAAAASGTSANALARQADGKWLIAGSCSTGFSSSLCAWRYTSDGQFDRSFGVDGRAIINMGLADGATGIAIQPSDDRILLGGYCGGGLSVDFCVARLDAGFSPLARCSLDVDGDGVFLSTTDSLLLLRIVRGVYGASLTEGVIFSAQAQRTSWELIREHLRNNPPDLDGDGRVMPETDGILLTRLAFGFDGEAVMADVVFPEFAVRRDWAAIRAYVDNRCDLVR